MNILSKIQNKVRNTLGKRKYKKEDISVEKFNLQLQQQSSKEFWQQHKPQNKHAESAASNSNTSSRKPKNSKNCSHRFEFFASTNISRASNSEKDSASSNCSVNSISSLDKSHDIQTTYLNSEDSGFASDTDRTSSANSRKSQNIISTNHIDRGMYMHDYHIYDQPQDALYTKNHHFSDEGIYEEIDNINTKKSDSNKKIEPIYSQLQKKHKLIHK